MRVPEFNLIFCRYLSLTEAPHSLDNHPEPAETEQDHHVSGKDEYRNHVNISPRLEVVVEVVAERVVLEDVAKATLVVNLLVTPDIGA